MLAPLPETSIAPIPHRNLKTVNFIVVLELKDFKISELTIRATNVKRNMTAKS